MQLNRIFACHCGLAYSQIYDFDKYLAADDTTVPADDESMQTLRPDADDTMQMTEKYIFQHSTIETSVE